MASYITSNADLGTYAVMPQVEITRLSTTALDAEDPVWATRHTMAWSATLARLARRNPKIEEADIDDTSVLKPAVCYYVAHLSYQWAPNGEDDINRSNYWYARWERAVEELQISDTIAPGEWSFRRSLRA